MKTQTFTEAIGDIVAFITGSSVSVADAANSAQQAGRRASYVKKSHRYRWSGK
jgi:hypothetical protein